MPRDVRLHLMQAGSVRTQRQWIYWNQDFGQPCEVPVPFTVIEHPKGNVVVDGGHAEAVANDPSYLPSIATHIPVMRLSDYSVTQVRERGIDPESVRYVIQTHLHPDHSGAVGAYPNARYIVQQRELACAYAPPWFAKMAYVRSDFDRDVDWMILNDENLDLFDDGTIRTIFTPGHSPGHMSVAVTLRNTGVVVLASDAAYTRSHYEHEALPGFFHSADDCVASVEKLRRLIEPAGGLLVPGHDPDTWPALIADGGEYD